ncbi:MAG: hypothetical protein ACTHLE_05705 [Agriterribacter sp.]
MKKTLYVLGLACIVLLVVSCNKTDISNQQQEETPGNEAPADPGYNPSDSAFVQIINESARDDAFVDTVYFSGGGTLGGGFPLKKGDTAGLYTTAAGSQVLYIKVSGGTTKGFSVRDSEGKVIVRVRSDPGTKIYEVEDVSVSSSDTFHITYNTDKP